MPGVSQPNVLAILCSDIHLSHRPPNARSAEPDWYSAMARPLAELGMLQNAYECPVVCAGDIFDHWKSPPELINFAIDHLPTMYAVPGQHDLPCHSYDDRHKSAYGTLVAAGKVIDLKPGKSISISTGDPIKRITLWGFPWGTPITPCSDTDDMNIAVVHAYVWKDESTSFPNAPKESRIRKFKDCLAGYDVVAIGDNHKGWQANLGDEDQVTSVFNCGGFFRRKIDELSYHPQVGLLLGDGSIKSYKLDCSEDRFIDVDKALAPIEQVLDMTAFLAELASLGDSGMNFLEAVREFITVNNVDKRVRSIIKEALSGN